MANNFIQHDRRAGCLENSDLENLDPRPEKLRPSGCLENSDRKITHIYTAWCHRVALRALIMKIICRQKKKQLAVSDTCNDHENYTQHSYRFFFSLSHKPSLYPQRVVSLEAIRQVCCVVVSCTNTGPALRDSSGGYLKPDTTFRGPYTSLILTKNCV